MLPRPRIRLPLWSAVAIVAIAYLIRSFIRGTLRPDGPLDFVVIAMLMAVIAIVAFMRREKDSNEARNRQTSRDGNHPPSEHASDVGKH